jgi:heptose-I-phosphate ethanolaminephosphotransferase
VNRISERCNLLLVFLLCCYFSAVPQFLFASSGLAGWSGLKYAILYSASWLLVPLLIPSITRTWIAGLLLVTGVCALVKLGYFVLFDQELSQSVFMAIMETTPAEAAEFSANYFRWSLLLILLVIIPAVWVFRYIRSPQLGTRQSAIVVSVIALILVEPFISHMNHEGRGLKRFIQHHETVEPWSLVLNYFAYQRNLGEADRMVENMRAASRNLPVALNDKTERQTLVLVIGESTNRQRMGIYGYTRDTTPKLAQMGNDLLIYRDVSAGIPYTIESLSTALTFAGMDGINKAFNELNLISLMQSAGFKVTWITNQQTLTRRNTLLTAFAQLADKAVFLNNNRRQSARQPDDMVFEPFREALKDTAPKKLVIVHLLGTHFRYDMRYPENFGPFDGKAPPSSLAETDAERELYNNYDNAVRYNDYVVSQLIEDYRRTDPYGFLLYFSDHGEEVFDVQKFSGRNSASPSTNMYSVPFLLWPSPRWAAHRDMTALRLAEQRPWSLTRMMNGWCDLASISYSQCNPEYSVFNAKFTAETRWVGSSAKGKKFSYEQIAEQEVALRQDRQGRRPALLSLLDNSATPAKKDIE